MVVDTSLLFHSSGVPLAGRLFRPTSSLHGRQPAIVVMGSWLTVKEQMASTYARRLADEGYTAFVFDFAGFGESRGEPRPAEMPARKIGDIVAAAGFLSTLAFVDPDRIACLAVCASAQYTLHALAHGAPIASFASVAGWYHDPDSVAPFYGGAEGVALRLERAHGALERYAKTGEITMVPAYQPGDDRAGMSFQLDYYNDPGRGAVRAWANEMAEMSWLYWLAFDGRAAAPRVTTPSLFVHGDGCVFPDHVRQVHAEVRGPKDLVWVQGNQIDFYDQPAQVDRAVTAVTRWFAETLGSRARPAR